MVDEQDIVSEESFKGDNAGEGTLFDVISSDGSKNESASTATAAAGMYVNFLLEFHKV
jgi:hypothetical protein